MDWRSDDVRWGPEAAAEAEGPEENISCSPLSHTTQSAVVLPFLLPTDRPTVAVDLGISPLSPPYVNVLSLPPPFLLVPREH